MIAGEDLTFVQMAGIVIVLLSIAVVIASKTAKPVRANKAFTNDPTR